MTSETQNTETTTTTGFCDVCGEQETASADTLLIGCLQPPKAKQNRHDNLVSKNFYRPVWIIRDDSVQSELFHTLQVGDFINRPGNNFDALFAAIFYSWFVNERKMRAVYVRLKT